MSFNNAVRDSSGDTVGFRCDVCDEIKTTMWGTVCNQCREKRDLAKMNTPVALAQEYGKIIDDLRAEIKELKAQLATAISAGGEK